MKLGTKIINDERNGLHNFLPNKLNRNLGKRGPRLTVNFHQLKLKDLKDRYLLTLYN